MKRRQFLKSSVAVAIAATVPALAKKDVIGEVPINPEQNFDFGEDDFSLEARLQSEDRCHRIGQTNKVLYEYQKAALDGINLQGTMTGRIRSGKSFAADAHTYHFCRANPDKKVIHVTPVKNAVIQMGNADFAELERRVAAYMRMPKGMISA